MAIDYGNYAQIYGGGPNMSGIADGITKALDKNKEARAGKISNFVDTWWDDNTKNFSDAAFGDVKNWFDGVNQYDSEGNFVGKKPFDLSRKNPMQALLQFKQKARKELSLTAYNEMLQAGHFNPGPFRRQYEEMIRSYLPMIEKKLTTYQQFNHLSNDDMQKLVQGNPDLQNFLLDYSDNSDVKKYALPDRTWEQWMQQKFGDPGIDRATGIATTAGKVGFATGTGTMAGRNLYNIGMQTPWSAKMDFTKNQASRFDDILTKSDYTKGKINKAQSTADDILKKAQNKFKRAERNYIKNYTGKSKNPNFSRTKRGKVLKNAWDVADDASKGARDKTLKGVRKVWSRAVEKHGKAKVLRMLAKRLGPKAAMSIMGKLGLAMIPAGVTQVASGLMLAGDVYAVYNILSDLAE